MKNEIIIQVYKSFNNRNIDEVLAHFHPDVEWPNGWEGGYVNGLEAVRDYWLRQWNELNPVVTPTGFINLANGKLEVAVHQLVKNLSGEILADGPIRHVYSFEGNLIRRMEIEMV